MKTTLKTIFISFSATFSIFLAVIYVSCKPDKCHNVVCSNGGACDGSGACVCASGYEGASCQTASRDKFLGNWGVVNTTTTTEPSNFSVVVSASTGSATSVTIGNFRNSFTALVNATISLDSIIIPAQFVQGNMITGSGYIYSTSTVGVYSAIYMSYQLTDTTTKTTIIQVETWGG